MIKLVTNDYLTQINTTEKALRYVCKTISARRVGGNAEKKLSKLALLRSSNVGASGLCVSPLSRGTGKIYTIYGESLSLFAPCKSSLRSFAVGRTGRMSTVSMFKRNPEGSCAWWKQLENSTLAIASKYAEAFRETAGALETP